MNKDCTISVNCNSYVVEHALVGKKVIVRLRHKKLRVFDDNRLVVNYAVPEGTGHFVQDPRFYAALIADRKMQERKFATGNSTRKQKGRACKATISPKMPANPIDINKFEAAHGIEQITAPGIPSVVVERRSLNQYSAILGEVRLAG